MEIGHFSIPDIMKNTINIALFGFGCAGQGFAKSLEARHSQEFCIKHVCVRASDKTRPSSPYLLTTNHQDVWDDKSIDVVVELIDDAEVALDIAQKALSRHIPVITANKKMIATHFSTLRNWQAQFQTPILYEAACAASIPVIRCLEDFYSTDSISRIEGVVNGSTNYILEKVKHGHSYASALKEAQEAGFAEADPSMDVDGFDAAFKLCLLVSHGFGAQITPEDIPRFGISGVQKEDFEYARREGKELKLMVQAKQTSEGLKVWAGPALAEPWYKEIANEFNALEIKSNNIGSQRLSGKGAGSLPTGQAAMADLFSLGKNYRYSYSKNNLEATMFFHGDVPICIRFEKQHAAQFDYFTTIVKKTSIHKWIYVEGTISWEKIKESKIGELKGQLIIYLGC
jgi:homoserine dehydrogenase